ncbi:hypothetical protein B296_00033763 [Ensete ventricosum]|uniref:Tetrahydrofolate dehydrogenase/cyclohydrolase catalytic domain-containing protein n=1 Tax=Ensete ventricosum TaxID=4639 RepID=A0A426ZQM3_ENSVE|nr:hypothetical protein B296_00033763 [Ensete ventricosum]
MAPSVMSDFSSSATARLLPFRFTVPIRALQFQPSVSIPLRPLRLNASRSTLSRCCSSPAVAAVSKQIKDEVAGEVAGMKEAIGVVPGLAVILVGSRKDSQTYVRNKKKACEATKGKHCLLQYMNEENILNAVKIEKDVDGFHPLNIGRLAMQGRDPLFVPCTPKGCMELLYRHGVEIKGKRAVVIGRSNIVGMPAALLLQVLLFTSILHYCRRSRLSVV